MTITCPKARYEAGVESFGNGSFAYLQPDGGWGLSNAGLVTSDCEALLIDTMFDYAHTRAMLDGFKRASDAKAADSAATDSRPVSARPGSAAPASPKV